jgi:outer membrane protein, multidrug efflux system
VQQAKSVAAYQESMKVSIQRYAAGKASYFEVLEAQIPLFPEETSLAQTELNRRLVLVQLYRALGGSWNLTDQDWQNRTITATPTTPPPKSPSVQP